MRSHLAGKHFPKPTPYSANDRVIDYQRQVVLGKFLDQTANNRDRRVRIVMNAEYHLEFVIILPTERSQIFLEIILQTAHRFEHRHGRPKFPTPLGPETYAKSRQREKADTRICKGQPARTAGK